MTLKTLDISGNYLGTPPRNIGTPLEYIGAIACRNFLEKNTTLSELYLENNKFRYQDIQIISQGIQHHLMLTHFSISYDDPQNKILEDLLKSLSLQKNLQYLDLSGRCLLSYKHRFKRKKSKTFKNFLNNSVNLKKLILSHCKIQDSIFELLPSFENVQSLTCLDLSYNKINNKGAKALLNILPSLPALETLSLKGNSIDDTHIQRINNILAQRKSEQQK